MKKLKLKKSIKRIIIFFVIVSLFLSIGIYSAIKIHKQKEYEKTYEYKLLQIGYDENEVSNILKIFQDKEIDYLLDNKKDNIYLELTNEKYFIYDNFYDYINYIKKNTKNINTLRNVIEIVNTKTDKEFYTNTTKTDINKKELMLVNKYNYLDKTYEPENLVVISTTYAWGEKGSQKVTQSTYDAYMNLWQASHEQGFYLMVSSSYRTYEEQEEVYERYRKNQGIDYADSIAARPGFSEHQTGYSLDIFEKGYTQKTFKDSESYAWLQNNAYKYGFIERYPEDKEAITGYGFESWHYRYVGVEAATYIHNNQITFDEYYSYYVK